MGPLLDLIEGQPLQAAPERLQIRWKGFGANLVSSLEMMQNNSNTDVRLVSKRGSVFKAHRLVLAAASHVLKELLMDSQHQEDPVLLLDDVEPQTVEDFLVYVYRGQVTLNPIRLAALLALGKSISLKGISDLEDLMVPPRASSAETFTGLSLLASAALNADESSRPSLPVKKRKPSNDENDPLLNGCSEHAINLSTKSVFERQLPISPLLNIPDPANFKWMRCMETTQTEEEPDREDTPPLAIDMSTTEAMMVAELPATPSPSPSSISLEPPPSTRSNSGGNNCNGEGKKWKSRQPKLCIHCDRYFSNQFNLKQVCPRTHIKCQMRLILSYL